VLVSTTNELPGQEIVEVLAVHATSRRSRDTSRFGEEQE